MCSPIKSVTIFLGLHKIMKKYLKKIVLLQKILVSSSEYQVSSIK